MKEQPQTQNIPRNAVDTAILAELLHQQARRPVKASVAKHKQRTHIYIPWMTMARCVVSRSLQH